MEKLLYRACIVGAVVGLIVGLIFIPGMAVPPPKRHEEF